MSATIMIDHISYDLPSLHTFIWKLLVKATHQKQDAFRTPVLATYGTHGVNQRTVVIRKVLEKERALLFHTDIRSPKVQEIQANNQVHWLFWNPRNSMQLRMKGYATIHSNDQLTESIWEKGSPASLKLYMNPYIPGSPQSVPISGLPQHIEQGRLTHADIIEGKKNFCVIQCRIIEMDWLLLRAEGHVRALFQKRDEIWHYQWITP